MPLSTETKYAFSTPFSELSSMTILKNFVNKCDIDYGIYATNGTHKAGYRTSFYKAF